jgi:hypothetical protein
VFGELTTIVNLDTFYRQRKSFQVMMEKGYQEISAVLLKSRYVLPAGIFIHVGILVKFLTLGFIDQADSRNAGMDFTSI